MNDSTDPDVGHEKPSHRGSDVQPTNCSIDNKQLSTEDDVIGNVHKNTAYTNEDHNSVLCYKELCERTIKSFSCTRCEMHFTCLEEVTLHCKTHKTVVEHRCDVCGKCFKWKSSLTIHLRKHSGERPFKCTACDKSFPRKDALTSHLTIHSGERPFKCDVCDKSFVGKSNLTKHQAIHSGERPFKCKDCDKSFNLKSDFNKAFLKAYWGTTIQMQSL